MNKYDDFQFDLSRGAAVEHGSVYVEYGVCTVCRGGEVPCLKVYMRDDHANVCAKCIARFFKTADEHYKREWGRGFGEEMFVGFERRKTSPSIPQLAPNAPHRSPKRDTHSYRAIHEETAEFITGRQVSHYFGGTPSLKTLHNWASKGGPIMPDKKQFGRNLYRTDKIREALK